MEPLRILGMILRGCSRKQVAEALTDEQRAMLGNAARETLPMNRQQRRKLERAGVKTKEYTKKRSKPTP